MIRVSVKSFSFIFLSELTEPNVTSYDSLMSAEWYSESETIRIFVVFPLFSAFTLGVC